MWERGDHLMSTCAWHSIVDSKAAADEDQYMTGATVAWWHILRIQYMRARFVEFQAGAGCAVHYD